MQSNTPQDALRPTRVLFYGVTGSGMSSAARRYAQASGLPEFSVDDEIGWLPGWQPRELDEERAIAARIAAHDCWVLDSVYSDGVTLSCLMPASFSRWTIPAGSPCSGCDAERPAGSATLRPCRRCWSFNTQNILPTGL